MIDPKQNNNEELIEALKTEEDDIVISGSSNKDLLFREKMKKILLVVIVLTVLLIIIFWLLSLRNGGGKSYSDIEDIMITASKKYYNDNKSLLPNSGEYSSVSVSKLVSGNYMKELSKYNSNASRCSGKVIVSNNDNSYLYTSYLDCGSKYSTLELAKKISTLSSDDGVYNINNEYVYRGEKVDNYVKLDDNLWRIVKVDINGEVVLISSDSYRNTRRWDDRYNNDRKLNYGYNDYKVSRIKEFLDDEVKSITSGENKSKYNNLLFSTSTFNKLASYKLCYGNSSIDQNLNNNTYECSRVIDNTKIGLLTLSDFINASLDSNCTTPLSKSCQNYNYLTQMRKSWWLVTGNSSNTYEVFEIDDSGRIKSINASSYASLRPVVHLDSRVIYKSGKGTLEKPYIIK